MVTNDVDQLARRSPGSGGSWPRPAPSHADAVRAFLVAREVSHGNERWDEIEALFADPRIDTGLQLQLMESADYLVESLARWYLQNASSRDLPDGHRSATSRRSSSSSGDARSGSARRSGGPSGRCAARRSWPRASRAAVAEAAAWHPELAYAPDVIAAAAGTGRPLARGREHVLPARRAAPPRLARGPGRDAAGRDEVAALGARRDRRRPAPGPLASSPSGCWQPGDGEPRRGVDRPVPRRARRGGGAARAAGGERCAPTACATSPRPPSPCGSCAPPSPSVAPRATMTTSCARRRPAGRPRPPGRLSVSPRGPGRAGPARGRPRHGARRRRLPAGTR